MIQRLISGWVYGAVLAAAVLLLLAPLLIAPWPAVVAATFLLLPAYMIHQFEEHDRDRFRTFFNGTVGGGHDVLTPLAVFVINVLGVWGVITLSLYGAALVDTGWAIVAVYLVLVNAAVHIIPAIVQRRYNPGLLTAIVVFVPLGGYTLMLVQQTGAGSVGFHLIGLAVAVGVHAAIMIHARRRLRRFQGVGVGVTA